MQYMSVEVSHHSSSPEVGEFLPRMRLLGTLVRIIQNSTEFLCEHIKRGLSL